MRLFRALGVARGVSEMVMADEFCVSFWKPGAAASTAEFQASTANAIMEIDMHTSDGDEQLCRPVPMGELNTVLQTTHRSSAPGPDHVTYSALANLGPNATALLLQIFKAI